MNTRFFAACLAAAALLGASHAFGYTTSGYAWTNGNITLQLQLGAPDAALSDGSTHWDDVATAALDEWNPSLTRVKLVRVKNSTASKTTRYLNNVSFEPTGPTGAFGARTLALTYYYVSGHHIMEADVYVNNAKTWDSYRGTLTSKSDLRRVLIHEFGHILGLDHPDEATPVQKVTAIMNSTASNIDTLQDDDRAAAVELYSASVTVPGNGSLSAQTVKAGSPLILPYNNSAVNVDYVWGFKKVGGTDDDIRLLRNGDGNPWPDKTYKLFSAEKEDAGTYYCYASSFAGSSALSSAVVTVTPVDTKDSLVQNLSARGRAGSGNDTFIVGFVVGGTGKKSVLIRAVGPTLSKYGISSPLADPKLTLLRSGTTTVATNDNWSSGTAAQTATIKSTFDRLGAFGLDTGSKDAALLVDLDPGVYSAMVDAQGGAPGITLVEVYDADALRSNSIQHPLINLSTRSYAGTGNEKLVAGFVVGGPSPKQVLLRAIGPGLGTYGVTGVNPDPNLVLYKDGVQIADNDDWALANQGLDNVLTPVFDKVGAFRLNVDKPEYDSALLITLPPGVYSAEVSGRHDETGVVLLEVYEVPE